MAKEQKPLFKDTPLADYAGGSEMAAVWLAAFDELLPATPIDFPALFAVIGPQGDETAQNLRVAAILGYDVNLMSPNRKGILAPLRRRAGLRLAQRYRGGTRGVSDRARRAALAQLAPVARGLIIQRFAAQCETYGLAGTFVGKVKISDRIIPLDRPGGVDAENMQPVVTDLWLAVQRSAPEHYVDAAWGYWEAWLSDWGMGTGTLARPNPGTNKQKANWKRLLGDTSPDTGLTVEEVEAWDLALGWVSPPPVGEDVAANWMFRDDLAEYHASAESGE